MARPQFAVASLLVGALLWPSVARAQAVPVELTWNVPQDCPSRASVLARVRELIGDAGKGAPVVRAEGEITKRGNAFELRLVTEQEGQRGERLVRSAQCEDLRGVAAVTLTLLLASGRQPDSGVPSATSPTTDAAPPAPPPPPPPPPVRAPEPPPEAPEASPESAPRSWRWLVAAPQLALQLGPLPRPTPALSVGLGVESEGWSLRVMGQWGTEQRVPSDVEGYGANAQRGVLSLWACREQRWGAYSLAPCLQGSLARLRVTGYGPILTPASQAALVGGVGAGAVGRARITSWLALMLTAGGQFELSRPVLWVERIGSVRRLAPVSALVVVGPELIF